MLKKSETNVKNMCLANTQSCLCMIYSYIVGRAGVKKWEGHLTPPAASVPDVLELLGQKCGSYLLFVSIPASKFVFPVVIYQKKTHFSEHYKWRLKVDVAK